MLRALITLIGSLLLPAAFAAEVTFNYDGCVNAAGEPVVARADAGLRWVADAGSEGGAAVIRYNPAVAPALAQQARLFLFAHECARVYLQQPFDKPRTLDEVQRADCLALGMLKQSNVVSNGADTAQIEAALVANPNIWQPARELKLASCQPAQKKPRGGMPLPQGVGMHSDAWNRCVQVCGDALFRCGRAAACSSQYESCVAKCAGK